MAPGKDGYRIANAVIDPAARRIAGARRVNWWFALTLLIVAASASATVACAVEVIHLVQGGF